MSRTEHIAVVGAGPMGNGIAQVFAAKGHEVIFFDPDPQFLKGWEDFFDQLIRWNQKHSPMY